MTRELPCCRGKKGKKERKGFFRRAGGTLGQIGKSCAAAGACVGLGLLGAAVCGSSSSTNFQVHTAGDTTWLL